MSNLKGWSLGSKNQWMPCNPLLWLLVKVFRASVLENTRVGFFSNQIVEFDVQPAEFQNRQRSRFLLVDSWVFDQNSFYVFGGFNQVIVRHFGKVVVSNVSVRCMMKNPVQTKSEDTVDGFRLSFHICPGSFIEYFNFLMIMLHVGDSNDPKALKMNRNLEIQAR